MTVLTRQRGESGPGTCDHTHPIAQRVVEAGRGDPAEFWIEMGGRLVHIRYFPARDLGGAYLGTMEVVQDVTAIRALRGQKRPLDQTAVRDRVAFPRKREATRWRDDHGSADGQPAVRLRSIARCAGESY